MVLHHGVYYPSHMDWDIFCKVIDNHGDAGVCWRLAAELAARGDAVRLWIDAPAPLAWMAPQGRPGVQVVHWTADAPPLETGDAVVEAFGCDPPDAFVARMAARPRAPAWINLEYLSAEPYVERNHGLPSPVSQGPGAGLLKHFFYPGFTPATGGLLREQDLPQRRAGFDKAAWLGQWKLTPGSARIASLFCYEPAALPELMQQLARDPNATELLVTPGRAAGAVDAALAALPADWNAAGQLRLHRLPLLDQRDYDHLLWSCDLNFVRGEDSVVRGMLAGVPCVWHIYPQDDGAHEEKLEAFLAWLRPAPDHGQFMRVWNGLAGGPLPSLAVKAWAPAAAAAARRIEALPELATVLRQFAAARVRI
jgi:uncharacterized repeat protein (TIGR03837 family)